MAIYVVITVGACCMDADMHCMSKQRIWRALVSNRYLSLQIDLQTSVGKVIVHSDRCLVFV